MPGIVGASLRFGDKRCFACEKMRKCGLTTADLMDSFVLGEATLSTSSMYSTISTSAWKAKTATPFTGGAQRVARGRRGVVLRD